MKPKGDVALYKKRVVEKLLKLMQEYPIVGVVNMQNLPAKQLQRIRGALQGTVVIWMTKKRLMKIAIREAAKQKAGFEKLEQNLKGMPALIFTKDDPFAMAKILQKNQSNAPIKAGQIAPEDIIVKAGQTNFSPGPVIGQLGALGVKTSIQDGKIAIASDAVVVKEGKEVSEKAATMLARLGIEPMKIGLQLVAVYHDGAILTKDILYIDEQVYIDQVIAASQATTALALHLGYVTTDTIKLLIAKAGQEAKILAREAAILTSDNIGELLAKAQTQAEAVNSTVK